MDKQKTGILIKEARMKKHYTQSELGDLLGVSNKAVSRWENGDSFPDIGVLENLSQLLEVKIQDLVVGEIQSDSNEAVGEIVRIAKIQEKRKIGNVFAFLIAGCSFLYSFMLGLMGTQTGFLFCDSPVVFPGISLAVILFVLAYWCIRQNEGIIPHKKAIDKTMLAISVITMIWIIIMVNVAIVMAGNGMILFGMKLSELGPFLNMQLMIAFWINFIFLIIEFFRIMEHASGLHIGMMVSYAVIHLVALYGDVLHRMSSVDEVYIMMLARTLIILIELVVAVIVISILKKISSHM